jgi:phage N-6-adenine-methyltransferase
MMNVHFMKQKTDWETPQDLFDALNSEFSFTLDPCASDGNAKVSRYFTESDDGLSRSWENHVVFMNPPYGKAIKQWMQKAYEENAIVVCLVPARTDSKWWHQYCMRSDEIRLLDRRLVFAGTKNRAPFPNAIVVFKDRPETAPRLMAFKVAL